MKKDVLCCLNWQLKPVLMIKKCYRLTLCNSFFEFLIDVKRCAHLFLTDLLELLKLAIFPPSFVTYVSVSSPSCLLPYSSSYGAFLRHRFLEFVDIVLLRVKFFAVQLH